MTHKQKIEVKGSGIYTDGAIGFSGPPGSGKSTIGKLVAKELNVPFFDLDDLIAIKAGVTTTKEIINNNGLSQFKQLQHLCLKEVLHNNNEKYILSFGGGVYRPGHDSELINKNRMLIKKHLYNICLIPSDDVNETVKILWPRQNDGKRETGSDNSNQYRSYIKDLIPQFIEVADKVVFAHNASIKNTIAVIMNEIIRRR